MLLHKSRFHYHTLSLSYLFKISKLSFLLYLTFLSACHTTVFAQDTTEDIISSETASNTLSIDESAEVVEARQLRIHFETIPEANIDSLGLWLWEDVKTPSDTVDQWPTGATPLTNLQTDHYGYYIDIPILDDAEKIGLLFNHTNGENLSKDLIIPILDSSQTAVWLSDDLSIYYYEPLHEEHTLRINYQREDQIYDNQSLWVWNDVVTPSSDWPNGLPASGENDYGLYFDVPIQKDAQTIGFLIVNQNNGDDKTNDFIFNEPHRHSQLFIKQGDDRIYTNPFYISETTLHSAEALTPSTISVQIDGLDINSLDSITSDLILTNELGEIIDFTVEQDSLSSQHIIINANLDFESSTYSLKYFTQQVPVVLNWKFKDSLYAYDGKLGLTLSQDQTKAHLALWSPSADQIEVIIYDKNDASQEIARLDMTPQNKGVWNIDILNTDLNLTTPLTGYYYHFAITRGDHTVLALDPYAVSLAEWNSSHPNEYIAKAAFVDVKSIGPQLSFANIEGYEKREDAIIYEVHVRDFTSDMTIESSLSADFGTFSAFIEKLDYIQSLGVTHIQLLPVMSYYFADESTRHIRETEYHSTNSNYNWGYDPQSYFALTGMYSQNPKDPQLRIEEFKLLIDAIHQRGMGVILDVVYNHTAQEHILEDLEPHYYYFTDKTGKNKTAFGGGVVGTTHTMTRKLVIDSILHWVNEYKIDGFRFDMMGEMDAETVQLAYDLAKKENPNILMLGEGWVTYKGDDNDPSIQPADQTWMSSTDSVASFSDHIRNILKSGFGSEGQPRFLTNGAVNLSELFDSLKAQPANFIADQPGDVIQYIAAHDNLTLYDVIAQSIKKDPSIFENNIEILRRMRLGNVLILTAQGTPFIHSGQEYGRTKQFLDPEFKTLVDPTHAPYKSTILYDEDNQPFVFPYFIHDSYDSSDSINRFDWQKALGFLPEYQINAENVAYTTGLIHLRRSTEAFRLNSREEIDEKMQLITIPNGLTEKENGAIFEEDTLIGYQVRDKNGFEYIVIVNADTVSRRVNFSDIFQPFSTVEVLVDQIQAGTVPILNPVGITFDEEGILIDPLTATVLRVQRDYSITSISQEEPIEKQHLTKIGDTQTELLPQNTNLTHSSSQQTQNDTEHSTLKETQNSIVNLVDSTQETDSSQNNPKVNSYSTKKSASILPETRERKNSLNLFLAVLFIGLSYLIFVTKRNDTSAK